jgi:hypothetical protein
MQLSLSYTMADLDDILPPGAYKLDLVDRSAMPLGLTIDVEIGSLRNANPAESQDLDDGPVALTAGASDVRYLLEANVRSTQRARFQHNQRTLEAGLRMADTLREGIQSLAETQADWIKSLVGSRGFFRNSATPQLTALPAPVQSEDGTEDEEEDELLVSSTDRAMELGLAVVTLINNFMTRPTAVAAPKQEGAKFDARSLFDWQHAARRGEAARAADDATETAPRFNSTAEVMAALPPDLVRKVFEVRGQLTPDEQSQLMQLLSAIPPDEMPAIAAQLEPMSTEEVVAMLRTQLATPVKGD